MYPQNGGYYPQNLQFSPPVYPQQSIRPPAPFQMDAPLISQHVLGKSPRFPTPSTQPSQFLPNLNYIRSTPPPTMISPRPEQNFPDWKNGTPPREPGYLTAQLSAPRAPANYPGPAAPQLNGTFTPPTNGFQQSIGQFSVPKMDSLPQQHFQRPHTFQMQSLPPNIPSPIEQQSPIRPSNFQLQPHNDNRPGMFNQQSPAGPSGYQQQPYSYSGNGTFQQQSQTSNNFQFQNHSMGSNPFGSQQYNSYDKKPNRRKNFNNNKKSNGGQNNWNGSSKILNNFPAIKKEKEDKNSSLPFSCDPCDRSFSTEIDLKRHLSEHIKCDSGSCQFEAHPKIVFLHKKMQHVAGYAEQINKLSNKEEIEKWREERKKRFPTRENIARRQAERTEKEARGEVIETPESTGNMKRKGDHPHGRSRNFKRRRNNRGRNQHCSLNFTPKIEEEDCEPESSSDDEPVTKLPMFRGVNAVYSSETGEDSANTSAEVEDVVSKPITSSFSESSSGQAEQIEMEENNSEVEGNSVNEIITVISSSNDSGSKKDSPKETPTIGDGAKGKDGLAPSNLVVYDVTDDDDEAPMELSSKTQVLPELNMTESTSLPANKESVEGSCDQAPSETQVNGFKSAKKNHETNTKKDQDMPRRKREPVLRKKEEPKRCATSLLRALYADDIKTERNKMFQCLRYIVQNNFFGIED